MSAILSDDAVNELVRSSMYEEGEDHSNGILINGIVHNVMFDPVRVEANKENIKLLLDELPNEFKTSLGGGWSFLNACVDKHGRQWTDYHRTMEFLFLLGMAAKLVILLLPREVWGALPGGMPYYAIDDTVKV